MAPVAVASLVPSGRKSSRRFCDRAFRIASSCLGLSCGYPLRSAVLLLEQLPWTPSLSWVAGLRLTLVPKLLLA